MVTSTIDLLNIIRPEFREVVGSYWKEKDEINATLKLLKWWNFWQRLELKSKLAEIDRELFGIGMHSAFLDLADMGMVKIHGQDNECVYGSFNF